MATPNYGVDLSCTSDIDPLLRDVTGVELMAQVCVRRLFCRQGRLLSNPIDNTIDARDFLSQGITPSDLPRIQGLCAGALLGDPRIFPPTTVAASFNPNLRVLTLAINATGAAGPFSLTLAVSAVTVELLRP